ncbi:MAG: DUF2244 domain-containing protein [Hyphomicrobium sp.]|jgi:uncharacterized membrane protein
MNWRTNSVVLYSAVLRPHRSTGARTIRRVVLCAFALLFSVSLIFVAAGAWPVAPFMGLEMALLFGALRLNDRAGNAYEAINLTQKALTVRRVDHWGNRVDFWFPPEWLQVNLEEPPSRETPLELRSHGRSLIIGAFLLPEERLQLAHALRRELDRLTHPSPAVV